MNSVLDTVIEWSFYLIFFLVPLIFTSSSSELFEYNKMMVTYGLTTIIVGSWLIKLILVFGVNPVRWLKGISRTPFDIPISLYFLSHVLSTIFSIDPHISVWGYYSRFHEGLLSTISYLLLYYAAVSNLKRSHVFRLLGISLVSALIVSVYGTFEHFGASPSCLFITGKFDVACWVQDVKSRVFATLGQPNWMAAYLDVIIFATLGLVLKKTETTVQINPKNSAKSGISISYSLFYGILIALYFAGLLFTKSRSGILGLLVGLGVFGLAILWNQRRNLKPLFRKYLPAIISLVIITLAFGLPFTQTEQFSLENILTKKPTAAPTPPPANTSGYIDIGISESSDIRKIVWTGALRIWKRYPVFGSGVETFAYAYYLDRPVEHNMVSEWDFLYNKAHNEFLNILATTGTVGFLSYLSLLGIFCLWFVRNYLITRESPVTSSSYLIPALFAAWISILVTNFFGFSVVIIGLYFFLIPAFCLLLVPKETDRSQTPEKPHSQKISVEGWLGIIAVLFLGLLIIANLISMWQADKNYAYGKNLDSVNRFVDGYPYLRDAVSQNADEPTFRDELSYNEAVMASAIYEAASGSAQEKLQAVYPGFGISAQDFINRAIKDSDQIVTGSPNDMPYWKTRTRVFYQLATIDPKYNLQSLAAIQKAAELAPTDAKVHYNLGILLGKTGQVSAAITTLQQTVDMKPDYSDAYYALGLFYEQTGDLTKARAQMEAIIQKVGPDQNAEKWLNEHK